MYFFNVYPNLLCIPPVTDQFSFTFRYYKYVISFHVDHQMMELVEYGMQDIHNAIHGYTCLGLQML